MCAIGKILRTLRDARERYEQTWYQDLADAMTSWEATSRPASGPRVPPADG